MIVDNLLLFINTTNIATHVVQQMVMLSLLELLAEFLIKQNMKK